MRLMQLSAFLQRWIFSMDGRWHRLGALVHNSRSRSTIVLNSRIRGSP